MWSQSPCVPFHRFSPLLSGLLLWLVPSEPWIGSRGLFHICLESYKLKWNESIGKALFFTKVFKSVLSCVKLSGGSKRR